MEFEDITRGCGRNINEKCVFCRGITIQSTHIDTHTPTYHPAVSGGIDGETDGSYYMRGGKT